MNDYILDFYNEWYFSGEEEVEIEGFIQTEEGEVYYV